MREIRLKFKKCGDARYISHLDLNRVFFRAVKRARIPLWYTEGYNPHPYLKYLISLPLGVESECELMDIRITDDDFGDEKVMSALNAVLPDGIKILGVSKPQMKPAEIYCAIYDIDYLLCDADGAAKRLEAVMQSGELYAVKRVKRGRQKVEEEVNLLKSVITYSVFAGEGKVKLKLLALAGQNNNLNPFLLAGTIEPAAGIDYEYRSIKKLEILREDFKEFK